MPLDEHAIIERFFRPLAGEGAFELRDDAAQLTVPPGCDLVVTTDMIAVGIHFLPGDPPQSVAQKALRVNLSDLAAKGAEPLAYTLSLGLTSAAGEAWLEDFAAALAEDQQRYGINLLGGDTIDVSVGPVISVTAFGAVPSGRMVHRSGARPGDALYVSGTIGDAAAGFALRSGEAGSWQLLSPDARSHLIARHMVPEPRNALASAVRNFASAAMDVSDGLVGDCDKLAGASGCTATIDAAVVPIADGLPREPTLLARLLTGGEDFEILAAVTPENERGFNDAARHAGVPVTRIGALVEGAAPTEVVLNGRSLALERRSWVHGKDTSR